MLGVRGVRGVRGARGGLNTARGTVGSSRVGNSLVSARSEAGAAGRNERELSSAPDPAGNAQSEKSGASDRDEEPAAEPAAEGTVAGEAGDAGVDEAGDTAVDDAGGAAAAWPFCVAKPASERPATAIAAAIRTGFMAFPAADQASLRRDTIGFARECCNPRTKVADPSPSRASSRA